MFMAIDQKKIGAEIFRFLVAGFLNLGFTYAVYRLSLNFLNYSISYTISIFSGVVFTWMVHSFFTFKIVPKSKRLPIHIAMAMVFYFIGLTMLTYAVEKFGVSEKYAPLLITALLTPASFLVTKATLVWQPNAGRQ